jgi:D-beta-D-heptose 7-phosphate kinase / D-beta-D-heptose 1-phosphate adenosyltransferase
VNQNLLPIIDAFAGVKVLVIGDAILDVYLYGSTSRLCREAPAPIVDLAYAVEAAGGAANTAANVRSLGGSARLVGSVGDDFEGDRLRNALHRSNIDCTDLVTVHGRRTLRKARVIAGGQVLMRLDEGDTYPLSGDGLPDLLGRLEKAVAWCDVLIVSDYGYGVIGREVLDRLGELLKGTPRPLVVDGKDLMRYRELRPFAIKPNYQEVMRLLDTSGIDISHRVDAVTELGERVLDLTGAQIAAMTLDREGAVILERGRPPYRTYAHPVTDSRAAGAGDTFAAALALAFAAGADTPGAAEIASAAADVVVHKDDTAVCRAAELQVELTAGDKVVVRASDLRLQAERWHQLGKRVVFTNGCFDIIHRGHITYLNEAKRLGDVLVVGVNSDDSVRRLKGHERPINCLEDRVQVLAALSSIDCIVPFEEDTPIRLIDEVRPDVFVKGGDYTRDNLVEASVVEEQGGRVAILPYVEDHSTTGIIGRIKEAMHS